MVNLNSIRVVVVANINSIRFVVVVNMNYIRVVVVVRAADACEKLLDANTAFINSVLKGRVYMEVPFGNKNNLNMVCVLDTAIYDLEQATSAQNKTIHLFSAEQI